jgi:ABC-type nitrate/sulfonate/bicarbonate transport system ATPase subunit
MSYPILQLTGVDKSFTVDGRQVAALRGIDLALQPGQFTALVGASGCGKSTLLRLIAGLEAPGAGEIVLDGGLVRGPSLDCGMIFQDHRLLPWLTVAQNIDLALAGRKRTPAQRQALVTASLELVGLASFANAFPRQLSGGMAQRVSLARGLVNRPRLLLLDEPFSALDSFTRTRLQNELQNIWAHENAAMILVTHDVEEALYLADRVIVLEPNPGRVKAVLEVTIPRPRPRLGAEFVALKAEILRQLGQYAEAA